MIYEGDLYRPPSEARSLIIQVTIGCSHNKCTFCHMYTDKRFRIRTREEILRDLEECSALYGEYVRRVFFADGDALIVKTPLLLELLNYVKEHFPYVERVTSYGRASNVLHKSEEELRALAQAGLDMVYLGAESGDDDILTHIQKGETAAEIIEAGQNHQALGCGGCAEIGREDPLCGHRRGTPAQRWLGRQHRAGFGLEHALPDGNGGRQRRVRPKRHTR